MKAFKKNKVILIYKKGNPYFYKSTGRSVFLVLFPKPWMRVSSPILIAAKYYQNSSSVSVPIILRLLLVIALLIKSLSILEIVKLHQPFFLSKAFDVLDHKILLKKFIIFCRLSHACLTSYWQIDPTSLYPR